MKIDSNLVLHVAQLARIEIPENEINTVRDNMLKVIDHMKELGSLNTDGVAPMFSALNEWIEIYNQDTKLRADVVKDSLPVDQILLNAPEKKENQFVVRAVIEEN